MQCDIGKENPNISIFYKKLKLYQNFLKIMKKVNTKFITIHFNI